MPVRPLGEESIFSEALAQPPGAGREAFLEQACAGDQRLRHRVEALLASHVGAGEFLKAPVELTLESPGQERPGTVIGHYKLLQQIGEGGMGNVFMADQESPVRRRVALKLIKPGMDSRQVIARFEAERQALALLDHQNIAKVFDAGTSASGRPYFVMELVHGVPLTRFCDENRLTLRQRLELFVPICNAIQHAHQKGIIHRDIKPGNVLVTMYDDKPVPKIIDFGIAKATEQQLTERTLFTHYGALVGTPEYMSPEQAEMNALGVDTRSDIYSLGVLLYELVTGTTPLERPRLREAALVEMVRLIREEEPQRPSLRLTSSGTLPKVAAACRTEPARLSQLLSELDWIVMKCLEKDRTRRYETANNLARDVERYLHDEPVEACPPSLRYRLSKTMRKHRAALSAVAGFAVLLIAGVIVSSMLAAWAMRAQKSSEAARSQTQASLEREKAARSDAEAARAKAESYASKLAQATQLANDGIDALWRGSWTESHAYFKEAAQIEPGLITTYVFRSALYIKLGLWDRAADDYQRRFELGSRANAQTCYEYALLERYMRDEEGYRRACREMIRQHGKSPSARYHLVRACTLAPDAPGDAAENARGAEELVSTEYRGWNLACAGMAWLRAGDLTRAQARLSEALETGAGSPNGIHRTGYFLLATVLQKQGRTEEARQALAKGHAALDEWAKSMINSPPGIMPVNWMPWIEGQVYQREARREIEGSEGEDDPRLAALYERALATVTSGDAFTFMQAGRAHLASRNWDGAAETFAQALQQLPYGHRPSSQESVMVLEMVNEPTVFQKMTQLRPEDTRLWVARGRLLAAKSDWRGAGEAYATSLKRFASATSNESLPASLTMELAALRVLAEDAEGYRALCAQAMEQFRFTGDAFVASAIARALALGSGDELQRTTAMQLGELAVDRSPDTAWFRFALGTAYWRAGKNAQAINELEQSLRVHPAWIGRGQNYLVLALASERAGQHADALKWLEQAKTFLAETDKSMANTRFGYAGSNYLSDWLIAQILLRETEKSIKSK